MTKEETVQDVETLLIDARLKVEEALRQVRSKNPDLVEVWMLANDSSGMLVEVVETIDECEEE